MKCSGTDAFTGRESEVEFGATIEAVRSGSTGTGLWLAPGWIDLQVNGFAGVDYNDPLTPHERHRALHPRTVRHRGDPFLPYCDHRRAGTDAGGPSQSLARERRTAGRRCDGRLPRGRPAHLGRGRAARRASACVGAQARFRRVPPLAGGHGESRTDRDALARLARGAALHRAGGGGGRHRGNRPHRRRRGADCRRRIGGRDALDASRQRRAFDAAAASELHLGPACGRPADGRFHRRRHSSRSRLSEGRVAGQGGCAIRAGDGRGHARGCRPGTLPSGRAGCGVDARRPRRAGGHRTGWPAALCAWIAGSRTSCGWLGCRWRTPSAWPL